eukprot:Opistho-1_new@62677
MHDGDRVVGAVEHLIRKRLDAREGANVPHLHRLVRREAHDLPVVVDGDIDDRRVVPSEKRGGLRQNVRIPQAHHVIKAARHEEVRATGEVKRIHAAVDVEHALGAALEVTDDEAALARGRAACIRLERGKVLNAQDPILVHLAPDVSEVRHPVVRQGVRVDVARERVERALIGQRNDVHVAAIVAKEKNVAVEVVVRVGNIGKAQRDLLKRLHAQHVHARIRRNGIVKGQLPVVKRDEHLVQVREEDGVGDPRRVDRERILRRHLRTLVAANVEGVQHLAQVRLPHAHDAVARDRYVLAVLLDEEHLANDVLRGHRIDAEAVVDVEYCARVALHHLELSLLLEEHVRAELVPVYCSVRVCVDLHEEHGHLVLVQVPPENRTKGLAKFVNIEAAAPIRVGLLEGVHELVKVVQVHRKVDAAPLPIGASLILVLAVCVVALVQMHRKRPLVRRHKRRHGGTLSKARHDLIDRPKRRNARNGPPLVRAPLHHTPRIVVESQAMPFDVGAVLP